MFDCSLVAEKITTIGKVLLAYCARWLAAFFSFLRCFSAEVAAYLFWLFSKKKEQATFFSQPIPQELSFTLDSIVAFFSVFTTAFLFEDEFFEYSSGFLVKNMLVFLLLSTGSFIFLKTHTTAFYKDARKELAPLFVAITLSTAMYYPLMLLMGQLESFSLTTPILNIFVCMALLYGARFVALSAKTAWPASANNAYLIKSLIIGDIFDVRSFLTNGEGTVRNQFEIVAIVAKRPKNFDTHVNGIPIVNNIGELHESHGIDFMNNLDAILTINGSNVFLLKLRKFCSLYKKSLFEISSANHGNSGRSKKAI
ncbi:MAG: hypothetical protein LBF84_02930 [Holosporales bacterium]|jgi:FlaA1/EpsC-like NDP-sugar epimerase|nr:hypothetical protein [Holosporales bacterium]